MAREGRYLQLYRGMWRYWRRVPKAVSHLDDRKVIQVALGTRNIEVARVRRDAMESADNQYWTSLRTVGADEQAEARYEAARERAKAFGYVYKNLDDLVNDAPMSELVGRVRTVQGGSKVDRDRNAEAVLGAAETPRVTLSRALGIFNEKCAAEELAGKSETQIKSNKKVRQRAVNNFIKVVGDKKLDEITVEDAVRFHDWWKDRIVGKGGKEKLSGNSGNRDLGNLRRIYREVSSRQGEKRRPNPFDGLNFQDPKRLRESPLPFPVTWIRDRLLLAESYLPEPGTKQRRLNPSALGIFLACIETGCRPSELCNILPERVCIKANIPHILIDFDADREIKTDSSVRRIPLVGIAFEVMRRFPNGFPRYRDKENGFSATMMKHLRRRGLLPSDRHVVYSLRHSFEDRLKSAHVDDEMRRLLMGHSIGRPEYGEGGDLTLRLELLKRIELPYDPGLLDLLGPMLD